MKAIKRTVAGLLATLMFASCFSFNFAFGADNYTDEEAIAVSKVNAASIMTGTENGFEPSKTLTRAEAAAIVVRMKGVPESQIQGAKGNTLFTDVPASSWAAGYINAASAMGIISGVGNGLFLPEREVTIVEFAAMAIRALGAGKLVDSIGTWPTNYVNFATEEKLFDGVLKAYTTPATRMDVAFMVVNTIEAKMWEKRLVTNTSEVTYEKQENKTILGSVLKISELESVKVYTVDTKERKVTFEDADGVVDAIADYDVVENVEIASLRPGHEVDVWYKGEDQEIIRIAPAEKTKTSKVSFSKIEKINITDNEITLVVNGKEKTYKYATEMQDDDQDDQTPEVEVVTLKFSLNTLGEPADGVQEVAATTTPAAPAKLRIGANGAVLTKGGFFGTAVLKGNKIEVIYAENYTDKGVVKDVKNEKITFEADSKVITSNASTLDLKDEDLEYVVTKNGKEIDITDIEKGDAVYYYQDAEDTDRFVVCVNNNAVEGVAKQISDEKYVKVDGTKYELAIPSVSIEAGSEVKLYLNAGNKVTMYQIIDGSVDSTVAMVKSVRKLNPTYDGQTTGDVEIELVQLDGTESGVKVVDLDETMDRFNAKTANTFANVAAVATALVGKEGSLVRYTMKNGKVVVRELDTNLTTDATLKTSYDKAKIVELPAAGVNYSDKSNKLGDYRLTEDTIIYVVKAESGERASYAKKLEKVAFEDLGASNLLKGYVYGVDKNTNRVEAVLFTNSTDVKRSTEKNYAVILEFGTYKDDADEDYAARVTLLLKDGSDEEYLIKDTTGLVEGNILEVFIKDGKVDEKAAATIEDTLTLNVYNFDEEFGVLNVIKKIYDDDSDTYSYKYGKLDVAEKCIYVSKDAEGKYAKGRLGDIKEADENTKAENQLAAADFNTGVGYEVTAYTAINTETGDEEVIAMFYGIE